MIQTENGQKKTCYVYIAHKNQEAWGKFDSSRSPWRRPKIPEMPSSLPALFLEKNQNSLLQWIPFKGIALELAKS